MTFIYISFSKIHRQWLQQRQIEKTNSLHSNETVQKMQYFKKLIKFRGKNKENEVFSFVPHSIKNVIEVSTESDLDRNRFAYDTVNNNEEFDFAGNGDSISGPQKNHYEIVEHSSPELKTNIINENNEKQETTTSFDVLQNYSEGSLKENISNSDVDIENKIRKESSISMSSSKNDTQNTSEKSLKDFEIKRFISEQIAIRSNNVTIKKSWGKWKVRITRKLFLTNLYLALLFLFFFFNFGSSF
jgi:hypothetical protein